MKPKGFLMNYKEINQSVGNLDLYLLDQILKGRMEGRKRVFDAGCGEGRNLSHFVNGGFEVYGMDQNPQALLMAMMTYKSVPKDNWKVGDIETTSFENNYFDIVICSAVLHFARDYKHFHAMMQELVRVTTEKGLIFIRCATEVGISVKDKPSDFTYLLEGEQLYNFNQLYPLDFIELPKSVVVDGQRSMGVLVMEKR